MANIIQTFPKGNGTDLSIIAEEFDNTKDYKVGDRVIKDKKYYVFTSDHDAGAWDSSDVDETNVSNEIPIGFTDEDMDEIKAQFHPVQYGNVRNYQIYDPDEHIIGEWREMINSVKKYKPIYERTVKFNGLNSNGENSLSFTFERAYIYDGYSILNNVNFNPLNFYVSSTFNSFVDIENGKIYSKGDSYMSQRTFYITIRYIKTTDEWKEV